MKALGIFLFIVVAAPAYSKGKDNTWRTGEVKLSNGDTLTGRLMYDLTYNVVKYQAQQELLVYPALHVAEFSFVDSASSTYRTFYSLPFNVQPDYKRLMFFEQLAEGKLSLFFRERKIRIDAILDDRIGIPPINEPGLALPYAPKITVQEVYAADQWGNFYDLTENTEEVLLQLMQDHREVMKEYIRAKNLNLKKRDDALALVRYYNALSDASRSLDPDLKIIKLNNKISLW